ncbi:hypothetical protein ACHAQH_004020 [Verticillium albo-atrum]
MPSTNLNTLPDDVLYIIADYLLSNRSKPFKDSCYPTICHNVWTCNTAFSFQTLTPLLKEVYLDGHGYVYGFKEIASLSRASRRMYFTLSDVLYKSSIKYDNSFALLKNAAVGNLGNVHKALLLRARVDDYEVKSAFRSPRAAFTALHYSAAHGRDDILQLLLQHNAKVDKPSIVRDNQLTGFRICHLLYDLVLTYDADPSGSSALFYAMACHRENAARMLINAGASLILHGDHALHALHLAAAHGSLELARQILSRPGQDANVQDSFGNTPLHYLAFLGGNAEPMASLLLKHGADMDAKNAVGQSPLMFCLDPVRGIDTLMPGRSTGFNLSSAKTLVLRGARSLLDSRGWTPVYNLCSDQGGYMKGARCRACERHTPDPSILQRDRYELMELLLKRGDDAEVEVPNDADPVIIPRPLPILTPLLRAIQDEDVGAVDVLLRNGADPNREANQGKRPIWTTSLIKVGGTWTKLGFKMVQLLLSHGARYASSNDEELCMWTHKEHGILPYNKLCRWDPAAGATFDGEEYVREWLGMGYLLRQYSSACHEWTYVDRVIMGLLGCYTANEAEKSFLQRVLDERTSRFGQGDRSERCLSKFMALLLESGITLQFRDNWHPKTPGKWTEIKVAPEAKLASQRGMDFPDSGAASGDASGYGELQVTVEETWDMVSCMLRRCRKPQVVIVSCLREDRHSDTSTQRCNFGKRLRIFECAS